MLLKWFKKEEKQRNPGKPEALLIDAIAAFENGDFDTAADIFIQIANNNQEHPLAHLLLARSFIQLGDTELAVEALRNHLEVDPESCEGFIYLGLALFDLEQTDGAEEAFEAAIKLKSNSVLARENLAIAKIEGGDLNEALDELLELHEANPSDNTLSELVILALGKLGRWDAAKRYASYTIQMAQVTESTEDTE